MSLRTAALVMVDAMRRTLGPEVADMRPTVVRIVRRAWSGGYVGRGDPVDVDVVRLPPFTKVRHVSEREIAGSGGSFEEGDVVIGPITPKYHHQDGTSGGFTEEELRPDSKERGVEIVYVLSRQRGHATGIEGDYRLIEFRRDRVLRMELVVGRERSTP